MWQGATLSPAKPKGPEILEISYHPQKPKGGNSGNPKNGG